MSKLQKTPLHENQLKLKARMVPFAGWSMPLQFTSILDEYHAVREKVGLFDVSHMGQIRVEGKDAEEYMRFLLPNDVAQLEKGHALYSPMCYPDGGVIDDLIVYMVDDQNYFVVVNASNVARDFDWMQEQTFELDVTVKDESNLWTLLSLQGPAAENVMKKIYPASLKKLNYMEFTEVDMFDTTILVSRTGYTGENGFELYIPVKSSQKAWEEILVAGKSHNLKPIGLGARDLLRLEMGYALYGHELDEKHSALASGLKWTVKLNNGRQFVGRDALVEELKAGSDEQLVFFSLSDRRIPRENNPILHDGQTIGYVASGAFSPKLGHSIGSGFIRWNKHRNGPLPEQLNVKIRDKTLPATVCRPPFLKDTSIRVARAKKKN